MSTNQSCFVWNVRGLNDCARRSVVREFLLQHRASVVCLQETKLSQICNALANDILGSMYDYDYVPAVNTAGGILLGWHRDCWEVLGLSKGVHSLSACLTPVGPMASWWITVVYGPQLFIDKVGFLAELLRCKDSCLGPWLICGEHDLPSG